MSTYKIYCCGITPNKNSHIGHLRVLLSAISVKKCLEGKLRRKVFLVINWTDIDSKILALNDKLHPLQIAEVQFKRSRNQVGKLIDLNEINLEPRVSRFIKEIATDILAIRDKISITKEGVSLLKLHHKLLNVSTEGNFFLWRSNHRGFQSPLGRGFPGWHIECTTMIDREIGSCDLHMGGRDLLFPHHVNEDCLCHLIHNREVAKNWLHVGLINIKGEKISKSSDNMIYLNSFPALTLRIYLSFFPINEDFNFSTSSLKNILSIFKKKTSRVDFLALPNLNRRDFELYEKSGFSWNRFLLEGGKIEALISLMLSLKILPSFNLGLGRILIKSYDKLRKNRTYQFLDRFRNLIESQLTGYRLSSISHRTRLDLKI